MPPIKKLFAVAPQYIIPQHALSSWMSRLTHCEHSAFKNAFIQLIIKLYGVNLAEAASQDLAAYPNFNAFFTRELRPGARPLAEGARAIVSPADGAISQIGAIDNGEIFQAKGRSYSAAELLGGDAGLAASFASGGFATIYLSPKDYHRLHMPVDGVLRRMIHIPGRLFSVNQITAQSAPRLFARNERVVCLFDTDFGPAALVLVGAIFVNSIETVWHGVVTPPTRPAAQSWSYQDRNIRFQKGQEFARFNMGSTIIMLFPEHSIQWRADLAAGAPLRLGERLGEGISG